MERLDGGPAAQTVLRQFRSTPAVSAAWLRDRIRYAPEPALARLRQAGAAVDAEKLDVTPDASPAVVSFNLAFHTLAPRDHHAGVLALTNP